MIEIIESSSKYKAVMLDGKLIGIMFVDANGYQNHVPLNDEANQDWRDYCQWAIANPNSVILGLPWVPGMPWSAAGPNGVQIEGNNGIA